MFKTEVIYSLFSNESIEVTRDHYYSQGVPSDYLVFHDGMCVSTVRLSDSRIVILGDTYQEFFVFDYIGDWYREIIRSEHAERYGLKPPIKDD